MEVNVCPECRGARLNHTARAVLLDGQGLHQVTALSVSEALAWTNTMSTVEDVTFEPALHKARDLLLAEITTLNSSMALVQKKLATGEAAVSAAE